MLLLELDGMSMGYYGIFIGIWLNDVSFIPKRVFN